MTMSVEDDDFWDKVEHRMKVTQPMSYRMTMLLLRIGILIILFTAVYLVLGIILEPARGYFLSSLEIIVHPIMWALTGVLFIIGGAILRFRAMGPIVDKLKFDDDW
ncbi:MAG: hypothetical protein JKY27_08350 [Magnetovibrio sp.]|nr:hypothetical protein [Magnetovibrio sp.]